MELSTVTTTTHLPPTTNRHRYLAGNAVHRVSLPFQRNITSLGTLRCTGKFPGETVSDETRTISTNGVNEFVVEKRDGVLVPPEMTSESQADQSSEDEQTQPLEFLNDVKMDSDNTYSILLYGSGAILALYLTFAIVASLESVPLFPKVMEVIGLGYTLWFTTRYLLFKRNREELKTKISEIKEQVLGSDSE